MHSLYVEGGGEGCSPLKEKLINALCIDQVISSLFIRITGALYYELICSRQNCKLMHHYKDHPVDVISMTVPVALRGGNYELFQL